MVKKASSKKTARKSHTVKLKKDDYEITITETPTTKKKPVKKVKKGLKRKTSKVKRVVKKTPRKKPTEVHYHSTKEIKVEKVLIENFVGLQKVMVNLSSRFDELSTQISRLLNLFEVSARAMAKKEFERGQDFRIFQTVSYSMHPQHWVGLFFFWGPFEICKLITSYI